MSQQPSPRSLSSPNYVNVPIKIVIPTEDEVGSIYNFGNYDSYAALYALVSFLP